MALILTNEIKGFKPVGFTPDHLTITYHFLKMFLLKLNVWKWQKRRLHRDSLGLTILK